MLKWAPVVETDCDQCRLLKSYLEQEFTGYGTRKTTLPEVEPPMRNKISAALGPGMFPFATLVPFTPRQRRSGIPDPVSFQADAETQSWDLAWSRPIVANTKSLRFPQTEKAPDLSSACPNCHSSLTHITAAKDQLSPGSSSSSP